MSSLPNFDRVGVFCVAAGFGALILGDAAQAQSATTFSVDSTIAAGASEDNGVIIDGVTLTLDPPNPMAMTGDPDTVGGVVRRSIVYRGNSTLINNGLISNANILTDTASGGPNSINFVNNANFFGNLLLSGDATTGGDDTVTLFAGKLFATSFFASNTPSSINLGFGDDTLILDGDGSTLSTDPFLSTLFVRDTESLRVQGDNLWVINSGFGTIFELDNGFFVTENSTVQYFSGTIDGDVTTNGNGLLEAAFVTIDGGMTNNASLATTRAFPLTVTGNVTMGSGSTTDVFVDPRGNAGTITVQGDLTVNAGATLAVSESLEVFPQAVTLTVISADGTSTGAANYASVTNDFPFLDATIDTSDPNNVTVTLTRNGTGFSGVAQNANQRNVGFVWEIAGAAAGPGTDALQLDGMLNGLATDAELRDTFTSWSGESQAASPRIATQASRGFGRGLERRSRMMHVILAQGDVMPSPQLASSGGLTHDLSLLSAAALAQPGQKPNSFDTFAPGFWVDVLGGDGDIDGDATVAGVDYDYYGLIGGFDWAISNDWIVGLSAGYTTGSYDVSDFSADGDIDTLNIAFYTAFIKDQWRFNSSIGYAFDSYDTQRLVSVPVLGDRIASADFDGGTFSIDGTATYRFDLDNDVKLEPFGTVEYFRSRTEDYNETGAGALNLFVSEGNYEALYTTLGARVFKTFQLDSTFLTPEARAGWQHEWLDHDTQFDARFLQAGVGAPVRITGADADDDEAALLGVGLTADFNRRFSLRFDYDTRIASNQTDQQFTLALRVPW